MLLTHQKFPQKFIKKKLLLLYDFIQINFFWKVYGVKKAKKREFPILAFKGHIMALSLAGGANAGLIWVNFNFLMSSGRSNTLSNEFLLFNVCRHNVCLK